MWKSPYTNRRDTLAAVTEQVLLLQAELALQSEDVLPASANEDNGDMCVCVSWSPVRGVQVVKHAIPIANSCPC
jgi:hypothetical protein